MNQKGAQMSQTTKQMVTTAIKTGVTTRSKSKLAVASNLYHLVKSLAKIGAVLLDVEVLRQAAILIADGLSLKIDIKSVEEEGIVSDSEDESDDEEKEEEAK